MVEVVGSMPSSLVQKMELLLLLPSAAAQVDESESMVYLGLSTRKRGFSSGGISGMEKCKKH